MRSVLGNVIGSIKPFFDSSVIRHRRNFLIWSTVKLMILGVGMVLKLEQTFWPSWPREKSHLIICHQQPEEDLWHSANLAQASKNLIFERKNVCSSASHRKVFPQLTIKLDHLAHIPIDLISRKKHTSRCRLKKSCSVEHLMFFVTKEFLPGRGSWRNNRPPKIIIPWPKRI